MTWHISALTECASRLTPFSQTSSSLFPVGLSGKSPDTQTSPPVWTGVSWSVIYRLWPGAILSLPWCDRFSATSITIRYCTVWITFIIPGNVTEWIRSALLFSWLEWILSFAVCDFLFFVFNYFLVIIFFPAFSSFCTHFWSLWPF